MGLFYQYDCNFNIKIIILLSTSKESNENKLHVDFGLEIMSDKPKISFSC